jgi:hypothetical protein
MELWLWDKLLMGLTSFLLKHCVNMQYIMNERSFASALFPWTLWGSQVRTSLITENLTSQWLALTAISYLHRHPVAGLRWYTGGATSSQVYFPFLSGGILTVSTDYLSPNAKSHSFYMEQPVRGHWFDENHNTLAVALGPSCYFQSNWTSNLYQNASWVHQERSTFPTSSFLG